MRTIWSIAILLLCSTASAFGQAKRDSVLLVGSKDLVAVNVRMTDDSYAGRRCLHVEDDGNSTEAKFVKIGSLDFRNGIIEVDVSGKPSQTASEQARGFVGVAFRINDDNTKFESFYIRPSNGRADDQIRRNHSVQYFSFPDFPWFKLRKEFPEKYESYVDLVPGEWTKLRIEVNGDKAKLFVHGNAQPTLLVNDLKLGSDNKGSIGLWIGPGTDAHFSNLVVTRN